MYRSLKVDTAATTPIFTTAEAKDFLKVDTTADDTIIDNLVAAATESCQIYTNQYFINTVVTQYSDNWKEFYSLYKSPVSSITHIKYYDTNDSLQTLAASNYILDDTYEPARIGIAVDGELPNVADRINAVQVKYTVGYGTASTDVPEGIRTAIILTVGNWYENRQSVITGRTATELPLSSQYLLDQFKIQVC
tara:strand:- start:17917 stop:18495 length:579 start_codon:yes stop_codon:yes gene_type:complete